MHTKTTVEIHFNEIKQILTDYVNSKNADSNVDVSSVLLLDSENTDNPRNTETRIFARITVSESKE